MVRANHAASEVGRDSSSSVLQLSTEAGTAQVGRGGFTQVDNGILRDATLSRLARLAYALLRSYGWQDESTYVGEERLASDLGVHRTTVARAMRELVKRCLVERRRRRNGAGWTSSLTTFTERVSGGARGDAQTATAASFPVVQDETGITDAVGAVLAQFGGVLAPETSVCSTSATYVCSTSATRQRHSTTKTQNHGGVVLTQEQEQVRDALTALGFNGATSYVLKHGDVGALMARVEYAQAHGLGSGWVRDEAKHPLAGVEVRRDVGRESETARVMRLMAENVEELLTASREREEEATSGELRSTWCRVRDALRATVTAGAWTKYFDRLELVELGDGRATVAHRDAYALDFVAHRYAATLARLLDVDEGGLTFVEVDR